jgi:GSH-dependent disulfide-bond oxidoreductase
LFSPEKPTYAVERYLKEGDRLTAVLEKLLTGREYFLDEYSIVDIAHFGWLWCSMHQGFEIDAYPNLKAWFDRVAARPAVQKGVTVPLELPDFTPFRSLA